MTGDAEPVEAAEVLAHALGPEKQASGWLIATEILGAGLNLACVILLNHALILGWPIGMVASALYILIFYRARLYSDVILQIFFLATSVYGWMHWSTEDFHTMVLSNLWRGIFLGICIVGVLALGTFMKRFTKAALPYADAFTTVVSIVAQILIMTAYVECWVLWILVNIVAIWVYWKRKLYWTFGLYILFLLNAIWGLYTWIYKLPV